MKEPLVEGNDFYFNERGFVVLTGSFHLKKGFCCGNGCIHCPYDYRDVPEPKKSFLLSERNESKDGKS